MADSGSPAGPPDPSGPQQGPAYGFSEKGFNRVTRAVRLVEKELVPAATGPRSRYPIGGGSTVRVAKTGASGILAMSGSTVAIGNVTFYNVTEAGALTVSTDSNAVQPARNLGGAIAANKFVLVDKGPWGWWIIAVVC